MKISEFFNKPKWKLGLSVGIVVSLLAGLGMGLYFHGQHKQAVAHEASVAEQHRQDSIAAAQVEAARLDSIRRDSLQVVNKTSLDLALCSLHGDVKTLSHTPFELKNAKQFNFSPDGELTYNPVKRETITRDTIGRIVEVTFESGDYEVSGKTFEWQGDTLTSITDWGWAWSWKDSYTRDDNGFIVNGTLTGGSEIGSDESTTTYYDYIVDEVGNWVERKYKTTSTFICFEHEGGKYNPRCKSCKKSTNTGVESRAIIYYTKREPRRYRVRQLNCVNRDFPSLNSDGHSQSGAFLGQSWWPLDVAINFSL